VGKENGGSLGFLLMIKKARRVLWYPTQAKVRLEWGTQPWVGKENCRSLGFARDDKGEGGAHLSSSSEGWKEPWAPRTRTGLPLTPLTDLKV
jgi:hypothetical protein